MIQVGERIQVPTLNNWSGTVTDVRQNGQIIWVKSDHSNLTTWFNISVVERIEG